MNKQIAFRPAARNVGLIALGALASVSAFAQTDPFTSAVGDITTKVTTYGGALVGLAAVAVAFYVAIKFVKKIPKAA